MDNKEMRQKINEEIIKTEKLISEYREMTQPVVPDVSTGRLSRMDAINNQSVTESALRHASTEYCRLCKSVGEVFYKDKRQLYFKCTRCSAIFMSGDILPDRENEKLRYMEHNNDVNDPGYRKFVSPITSAIISRFTPKHKGLDFGAGTGPVISKILQEEGYSIEQYDPFFINDTSLLERKYDYIACCEVIEHFHYPEREFRQLRRMLLPGGRLFCMTGIYDHTIDFGRWYYKNDPTHVFIYQRETFELIKREFGFSKISVEGRLVTFSA